MKEEKHINIRMFKPQRFGFFLPPSVSLMGVNCAIDTLRLANRHYGKPIYEWVTIGENDEVVSTTSDIKINVDCKITDQENYDLVFICGGIDMHRYRSPDVERWLRGLATTGCKIGGITTGAFTLAHAGLLNGYSCTIHWEEADLFRTEFPEIMLSESLFVIDRDRITSAGGIVTVDLFLQLVAQDCGSETALSMASALLMDRIRDADDKQSFSAWRRNTKQPAIILNIIRMMEANIETPVSLKEIASAFSMTPRHLRRIFGNYLSRSPIDYYQELRLQKARLFLQSTTKPVLEIALECGYQSHASFSRSYRETFGISPSMQRNLKHRNFYVH